MGKRKFLLITVLAMSAVTGVAALMTPTACDYTIDGRLAANVWLENIWAGIARRPRDCDPWSRLPADMTVENLKVTFSINAFAGPSSTEMYIQKDGRGYFYADGRMENRFLGDPPEKIMAELRKQPTPDAFYFVDKALFQNLRHLLSPLRRATGPMPREFAPVAAGAKGKVVICGRTQFFHSSYMIDWVSMPLTEFSYFDNSSSGAGCPAMIFARSRLDQARAMFYSRRPGSPLKAM